jgi:hypothetical protein
MDDLLPQTVRPASFAYPLPFVFVGALVLAWSLDLLGRRFGCNALWMCTGAVMPFVHAMRGATWTRALPQNAALCALVGALTGFGAWRPDEMATPLALQAAAGVVFGLFLCGFGELAAWPLTSRIRAARLHPRGRNIAGECALITIYGVMVGVPVWNHAMFRSRATLVLVSNVALGVGVCLAALVAITWELRLRLRVRAILAGRVPGWRAIELPPGAPRNVPALLWLDGAAWATRSLEARLGELRAIVRDAPTSGGAYRAASEPYVLVPPRVSLLGARSMVCALCVVGFFQTAHTFNELSAWGE